MSIAGMSNSPVAAGDGADFDAALSRVMHRVRASFADLISGMPGGIRRASDLGKALGVDAKTSWRVFKVATATDPVGVSSHVPSRASMRRVVQEASRLGAPAEAVGAVEAALGEFDALVERFAGDRATFDSMASAFGGEESSQVDQMHYRAAYRANAHILGVTSRTQYVCSVLHRNAEDPRLLDVASIKGYYDLRRLRRDVPLTVVTTYLRHDTGEHVRAAPEPLDGRSEDETGYLREFCGEPASPLRVVQRGGGNVRIDVASDSVGIPSNATYLFGQVMRAVAPIGRTADDSFVRAHTTVRMPTELLVRDVLIHHGTYGRIDPRTYLLSDIGREERITDPQHWKALWLPNAPGADYLGLGTAAARTLDVPRHSELLVWALERLGWNPGEFHVYRCRVEYPVLPSSLVFEFELPDVDGGV